MDICKIKQVVVKLSAEQFGTWKEANFEPEDRPWVSLFVSILGSSSSKDKVNLARMTRQTYILQHLKS